MRKNRCDRLSLKAPIYRPNASLSTIDPLPRAEEDRPELGGGCCLQPPVGNQQQIRVDGHNNDNFTARPAAIDHAHAFDQLGAVGSGQVPGGRRRITLRAKRIERERSGAEGGRIGSHGGAGTGCRQPGHIRNEKRQDRSNQQKCSNERRDGSTLPPHRSTAITALADSGTRNGPSNGIGISCDKATSTAASTPTT